MPDDQHGEIGRRVVGAVVMQNLAACRAGVANLEVLPEQPTLAATGTALRQPTQHRVHKVARRPGYLIVSDHELDIGNASTLAVATNRPRSRAHGLCSQGESRGWNGAAHVV